MTDYFGRGCYWCKRRKGLTCEVLYDINRLSNLLEQEKLPLVVESLKKHSYIDCGDTCYIGCKCSSFTKRKSVEPEVVVFT